MPIRGGQIPLHVQPAERKKQVHPHRLHVRRRTARRAATTHRQGRHSPVTAMRTRTVARRAAKVLRQEVRRQTKPSIATAQRLGQNNDGSRKERRA